MPSSRPRKILIETTEEGNRISRDTLDVLRRELEGKINLLSPDIKDKLAAKDFYWFFGILVAVLITIISTVFGFSAYQVGLINGQINGQDGINSRIAVMGDRVNEVDNKLGIKH